MEAKADKSNDRRESIRRFVRLQLFNWLPFVNACKCSAFAPLFHFHCIFNAIAIRRMGSKLCKGEEASDEAMDRNNRIELDLNKERIEGRKMVKILLLGSADSGKSTIVKQMRILHTDGFSETELVNYRYMLHTNYIGSLHYIARGIAQLQIAVPPNEKDLVDKFDYSFSKFLDFDDDNMIKLILKFLSYDSVTTACKRLNEFYLPDNTNYLLAESKRILMPNYLPTAVDIIHARASTTGVHEITFGFRRFSIRLIDVGGQKTERRKWIHCFDSVSAILYVVSLSCYDQSMEEDPSINRMDDSIDLFRAMFFNPFLIRCSFILFLNKKDLFELKLRHVPLHRFYPAFEDRTTNITSDSAYAEAVEFVKKLFLGVNTEENNRHIYTHVTNATDTKNIEFVFGATCDIVLQNNLTRAGMT
ncbi:hypothetical protein niasHT_016713 [Heterodera trifolii]|uniref:Uncharacterized protein n=1 Tax=Heterodera trifolii TaxID=157864 RepID=A0ABD2L9H3_9BILA